MNTKLLLVITLCLWGIARLAAQGTAFTYQGRLLNQGSAANGRYDMEFTLHDAPSGGARVGGAITNSAIAVSNGLFTTIVDFGAGAFNGSARWLQIGVRTNGSAFTFAALSPRQSVTPAPYAISAGSLTGVLPDSQLSANIPRLNANQTFSGNVNFTGSGNIGIGTTFPNDAKLDVEGNLRLNDYDLFLRGGADRYHGLGWYSTTKSFAGAAPDGPVLYGWGGGLLGTRVGGDKVALSWNSDQVTIPGPFALNFGSSTRQMINLWNANYGIGVQNNTLYQRTDGNFAWFRRGSHTDNQNTPGVGGTNLMLLDSSGHLQLNAGLTLDLPGINNGSHYPGLLFGAGSGEAIASKRTSGGNQYGLDFYTGFQPRLSIANNGNVGIGTTNPQSRLDVNTGAGTIQFRNEGGLTPGINIVNSPVPGVMRFRNALEIFPDDTGTRPGSLDVRGTDGSPRVSFSGANSGKLATFNAAGAEVASIDTAGNIHAKNMPAIRYSQGNAQVNYLNPGENKDVDSISVVVQAPGYLFITAHMDVQLVGIDTSFTLALYNTTTNPKVELTRVNVDNGVGNNQRIPISLSWVLPVSPGTVSLTTTGYYESGANAVEARGHNLTAIYLPRLAQ